MITVAHAFYDRRPLSNINKQQQRRLNPIADYFLRVLLLYFFESFMTHVCSSMALYALSTVLES